MAVVSLSTVGYGDMVPTTIAARILVIFSIIVIVCIFATASPALMEMLEQWSWQRAGALPPYSSHDRILVVGGGPDLL